MRGRKRRELQAPKTGSGYYVRWTMPEDWDEDERGTERLEYRPTLHEAIKRCREIVDCYGQTATLLRPVTYFKPPRQE